jgi:hypothetical protein
MVRELDQKYQKMPFSVQTGVQQPQPPIKLAIDAKTCMHKK